MSDQAAQQSAELVGIREEEDVDLLPDRNRLCDLLGGSR